MIPYLPNHRGTSFLRVKKTVLFTFALCFTTLCFSQGDFRKGYMVKSTGDTIFGFVQYRDGHRANRNCSFSENGKETIAISSPKTSKLRICQWQSFRNEKSQYRGGNQEACFLEIKIRGQVSLFKYEKFLFVQGNTDSLRRLSNDKKEQTKNDKTVINILIDTLPF